MTQAADNRLEFLFFGSLVCFILFSSFSSSLLSIVSHPDSVRLFRLRSLLVSPGRPQTARFLPSGP